MAATLPNDAHQRSYPGHSSSHANININKQADQLPVQKSRRQWNVQDGPRGLLRRMRSQLAEDGDEDSQLVLAKTLLSSLENNSFNAGSYSTRTEEGDSGDDRARQAVFWLTRASLQGNQEATSMLQDCLDRDVGISEHNYHEVRQCLAMDRQEKLARRAAQLFFVSLSDGNEFVTSSMLSSRIRALLSGDDAVPLKASSAQFTKQEAADMEARYGGERFLEEHLTAAANSYHLGYLPPIQHFLPSFSDETASRFAFKSLVKYLGGDIPRKIKYSYYNLSIMKVVIASIFVYSVSLSAGKHQILSCVPFLIQLATLLAMAVATATILLNYSNLDEFRVWSVVLKHFCPELDTDRAEKLFQKRWYIPYLAMLLSLLCYLAVTFTLSPFIICLQIPILFFFAFLSLSCTLKRVGIYEHLLFIMFMSARTPFLTSLLSNNVSLFSSENSNLLQYYELILSSVDIKPCDYFSLHIGLRSLIHVVWLLTLIACWINKGWHTTSTLLVSITWLSLSLHALQNLTFSSDVVYATIVWSTVASLPFLCEVFSMGLRALGLIVICQQLNTSLEVTLVLTLAILFVQVIVHRFMPVNYKTATKSLLWSIVISFVIISSYKAQLGHSKSTLKWDVYRNLCSLTESETEAQGTLRCRLLLGSFVSWQGQVHDITLISESNVPEFVLGLLPLSPGAANFIRCQIGEPVTPCSRVDLQLPDYERCVQLHSLLGKDRCHLSRWSSYKVGITAYMGTRSYWESSQDNFVELVATGQLGSTVLQLKKGERFEFEGMLDNIGRFNIAEIILSKLSCSRCVTADFEHVSSALVSYEAFSKAVVATIGNFFLHPTCTF